MLETGMGKTIKLIAEGPDAEPALDAICALIDAKFDEAC
jgi:phosphocarrier protein NPr